MTNADVLNDLLERLENEEFKIARYFKSMDHAEAYIEGCKDCYNFIKSIIISEIQEGERKEVK